MKNQLFRVPVRYGIIGAGLHIGLFLILYFITTLNPLIVSKKLDSGFILLPIFIFFSIKEFKDFKNNKQLRFWQGMTVGFVTYTVIAFGAAVFTFIMLEFVDPALMQEYIQDRLQMMAESKESFVEQLGATVYDKTIVDIKAVTAYIIAIDELLKKMLIGMFFTIIISVILRK